MPGNILILGTSARAAAYSAMRAGFQPWCLDLYHDEDLRKRCPSRRLRGRYPNAFLSELEWAPECPFLYTGALENHGFLISQLADLRPLWGNDAAGLIPARDPETVAYHARGAGLPVPRLGYWPPGPGMWVVKPLLSGGGSGVRFWAPELPRSNPGGMYVQEYIDGEPVSAVFCASPSGTVMLGATKQLIGTPWLNARAFRYAGNVGPLALHESVQRPLEAFGQRLAGAGLRGLFGVDGVLAGGQFWPVEVNPRYTASVEVLELATGLRAIAHHARAFGASPGHEPPVPRAKRVVGKAILYTPEELTFPADGPWMASLDAPPGPDDVPAFADISAAGTQVAAGGPVVTILVEGDSEAECIVKLRQRAEELEKLLWPEYFSGAPRKEQPRPESPGHFTPRSNP